MGNQLIPQEEFQTYTSLDGTVGGSQTESPSDSEILTTRTLNATSISNNDLDRSYDLGDTSVITDYNTLLVYINELLIRFDASPKYYQKEDYRHLIKTIVDSLRYLYTENQAIIDLEHVIHFMGIANTSTNPTNDAISTNHKYPGMYILSEVGEYINFGLVVTEEELKNSIIYAVPNIVDEIFLNYNKINYDIVVNTKLSEFENDSNFISEAPNDGKQYIRKEIGWEEIDSSQFGSVKSVNNESPDENGNVQITIPIPVYTDGTTITGDGSEGNPLVANIEIIESEVAPLNPIQGLRWFNLTNGVEYTYLQGYWVDLNGSTTLQTTHENLTDKNSEADFQHVDTTVTKETLAENDKVALYDSETGKVVLTPREKLFDNSIIQIPASAGAATYNLTNNKQTLITGVLPNGVNSTLTLPAVIAGDRNEVVLHFKTNATAAPTLVYSGFTPTWLNGIAISMKVNKQYTIVFEQINGIVKTSWGEF